MKRMSTETLELVMDCLINFLRRTTRGNGDDALALVAEKRDRIQAELSARE